MIEVSMSEMVERVARAIAKVDLVFCLECGSADPGLPALLDRRWRDYAEAARAAIEAMREPNVRMIAAGQRYEGDVIDVWRAMIDAALREPA
jgi:hypothetical protein